MPELTIDDREIRDVLGQLLAIPSPTGLCGQISDVLEQRLIALDLDVDRLRDGGLRATWHAPAGDGGAVGFIAHMDTLGAQVKQLKDNGRIELVPIGTWSARFAEGARVRIHCDEREIAGTVLPLKASGHAYNEEVDGLAVGWPFVELRVDEHASSRDDLVSSGINVGDIVSIDPQPEFLDNGYIVSRHLDDKAGIACMLAAISAMRRASVQPGRTLHFMFTVSEETGIGASSIVRPDVADLIAVDIGIAAPGQNSDERRISIALGDQTGPFDRDLAREMIDLCERHSIDANRDVFRYYKSDLLSARVAGADARMGLLAFGVDASHGYERTHQTALTDLSRVIALYASR